MNGPLISSPTIVGQAGVSLRFGFALLDGDINFVGGSAAAGAGDSDRGRVFAGMRIGVRRVGLAGRGRPIAEIPALLGFA